MTFISSTTPNPNFTSSVLEKHYADQQEKSSSCDSSALQHHQLFKLVLRSIKRYLFQMKAHISTETSVSVSLGHAHYISQMLLPDLLKWWKPSIWACIILFLDSQVSGEWRAMRSAKRRDLGGSSFLSVGICFPSLKPLHLILAACFKVPEHWVMSSLARLKWTEQSQASTLPHLLQSCPPIQHATVVLFLSFFWLISIMKGLIMLMKCPNGLVLSVGDTAVGLGGKSCAKCVT